MTRIAESKNLPKERYEELPTPWTSVYVAGLCAFVQAVQFSIFFSSMWPYLLKLAPSTEETMFGYIVALYSIGQCIAAPSFGYWSNQIKQVRLPLFVGFSCMMIGNVLYTSLQFVPVFYVPFVMMIARFVAGSGTGNISLLRAYVSTASSTKDRSRAIACISGGLAVGTMIGPAFQLLATPLGEEGIGWGHFRITIYNSPALLALLLNIFGILLVVFLFEEKYQKMGDDGDKKETLPPPDMLAIAICVFTRFTQIFVQTTVETYVLEDLEVIPFIGNIFRLGSAFSMLMFDFSKEESVTWTASSHAIGGGIGALLYILFIAVDTDKYLPARSSTIISMFSFPILFIATYSFPFLPETVSIKVNGTDGGCDITRFDWCEGLTKTYPWIYYSCYVLVFGIAFSIMNTTLATIFSKIIGPRRQGTLHGVFQMSGSIGRMAAPLLTSHLYTQWGPRSVWGVEFFESTATIVIWIVFISRMVPFEIPTTKKKTVESG